MRGKGTKLGKGGKVVSWVSPAKVRLSQDRLPILHTNVVHAQMSLKANVTQPLLQCSADYLGQ